mmetsp:Transcript_16976/g.40740  ORF Transcript_16976/g.40740 Transcript_16976/m.40740 type:complete len:286 (-) Transcript_16976:1562-2419(-)
MLGIHQGNDVTDGLQESGESLAPVLADAAPQRLERRIEGLNAVRRGRLSQRRQCQRRDSAHLLLLVSEAQQDGVDKRLQMRQHGTPHQYGDLLDDLDARVSRLPALGAPTDRLKEGDDAGYAQCRGHHGKRPSSGVADVLVLVVDVWPHGGDHGGQPGGLGEVADDLAALHTGVVVLVNQQRLYHHQNLVHVGPDEVVKLVEDAIDDLDQQVPLLVLEGAAHHQRQNLVAQRPRPEVSRLLGDGPQGRLAHWGGAVLDLQEQLHDLVFLGLLRGEVGLRLVGHLH